MEQQVATLRISAKATNKDRSLFYFFVLFLFHEPQTTNHRLQTTNHMVRLFIAVDVPEEVSDELKRVQRLLPRSGLSLSRDFHLTLKFLGEVDPKKAGEVAERLKAVRAEPFEASLAQVGFFPLDGSPRVVWLGVDPKDQIALLQKKVDGALDGLFPKEKSFVPHLTLGRMREVLDKQALKEFAKTRVQHMKFRIDSFSLIESTLSSTGAVHREIARYPFKE